MLRVHGFVGLEIIEGAAGAPGPGTQRSPIIQLARLALVHQTDDAARQAGAIVCLNAGGSDDGIAPAFGQNLLLPGRPVAPAEGRRRCPPRPSGAAESSPAGK